MKNRNCIIYWTKAEPNEAVCYYVGIIEQALKCHFTDVVYTHELNDIGKNDVVVTISIMSFLSVWKRNHRQAIIYWWQGIAPEEGLFGNKRPSLRDKVKYRYYNMLERLCLHISKFNLFVSRAMVRHYQQKYGFHKENYIIMPCFNQKLSEAAFCIPQKYESPTFVYAGSILAWQCVDEALQLYGMVKRKYPNATMTLLTRNQEQAQKLIDKHHLADVTIKFVTLDKLNEELSKYKYGMLLRSDDPVNNVATPTKFNSYLAVGIIPVISRVIGDYGSITNNMKYAVCINDEKELYSACEQIDYIEQHNITPNEILVEYKRIFDDYYDEPKYVDVIIRMLQEIFPEQN